MKFTFFFLGNERCEFFFFIFPIFWHRAGTREVHNKLEKNRRAHLKECFELLKRQLPVTQDEKKSSNLSILHSALRHIQVSSVYSCLNYRIYSNTPRVWMYFYQFLFNGLNTIILTSKHLFLNILTYFIRIVVIFY